MNCWLKIGQLASAMLPLRSPKESPEVSWLENEVEALVVGDIDVFTDTLFGDKEVFGSDDPEFDVSDMEWPPIESEEPSDAKSEVGETESGVKPKSLRGEQLGQYFQRTVSVFPNNCISISKQLFQYFQRRRFLVHYLK